MHIHHPILQDLWQKMGFLEASPIQEASYDKLYQGESAFLQAPTGTGKTLAYLIPSLSKIEPGQGCQLLILAPSQELTMQILRVAEDWVQALQLKVMALSGGANLRRQLEKLKDKPEIIVASPGRLLEILENSRKLKVHQVKTIIYDEADYLLSPEHRDSLEKIAHRLPRDVQSIYVSATFKSDFQEYLSSQLKEIEHIQIGSIQNQVDHQYIFASDRKKVDSLRKLGHIPGMMAMVFFDQIHQLDTVYDRLIYHAIPVIKLHGHLNQIQRQQTMELIRQGKLVFLLTTDLAARGLDIEDLPYVIHYNLANDLETYVHRSGRTGRMGKQGHVLSIVNEQEARNLQSLLDTTSIVLKEAVIFDSQIIPPEDKEAKQLDYDKVNGSIQSTKTPTVRQVKEVNKPTKLKPIRKKIRDKDKKNEGIRRKTK